ncbi:Hsp20 family protein [Saccharothrix deserti]|uniref:Hsp20 family protein n=1 Tax=Saccharothrix deserti TaxID=2593674 RepID=UPI00131BF699|nr:Hsp20 family protein [Saccharothrix deserti]
MVERLTVRRRNPCAGSESGRDSDPVGEMDVWWDRIGRMTGREWDLATADDCPLFVDVAVTEQAYFFATMLEDVRRDDVRVEIRDHDLRPDGTQIRRDRVGITVRPTASSGPYYYCATVPAVAVDVERIDAWLLDGVVVVRVPIG